MKFRYIQFKGLSVVFFSFGEDASDNRDVTCFVSGELSSLSSSKKEVLVLLFLLRLCKSYVDP
jgi:hypothetical protein